MLAQSGSGVALLMQWRVRKRPQLWDAVAEHREQRLVARAGGEAREERKLFCESTAPPLSGA